MSASSCSRNAANGKRAIACRVSGQAASYSSTCTFKFLHSSANQDLKDGQTLKTTTLPATATWTATWTSSLDPTPRVLPTQEQVTTAEVPVAEIQALVTG